MIRFVEMTRWRIFHRNPKETTNSNNLYQVVNSPCKSEVLRTDVIKQ